MSKRTWLLFCAFFLALIGFQSAHAIEFDSKRYDVYYGDLNGDGEGDYYLHGKDFLVLLHGDIVTPIVLPAFASQKLLTVMVSVVGDPTGQARRPTYPSASIVDPPLTQAQITSLGLVKLVLDQDFLVGDFNGDGLQDVVLRRNGSILTVVGTSGDTAAMSAPIGEMRSFSTAANVAVKDVNNDGKDDLVVLGASALYADEAYDAMDGSHIASLDEPVVQTATLQGASTGSFRVDESGAATYQIPLTLPEGTAGVAPELSLNYSSQGGSGFLGQGWSLAGTSAITRCRQTLAQDGVAKPISWSTDDRFCLDGQRLQQVSTSSTYVAYRTEIDSYVKIRAHGTQANPNYFVVDGKDGSRRIYGQSTHARHTLSESGKANRIFAWALERSTDSVGNAIDYVYAQEAGDNFRLANIYYAYGSNSSSIQYANANVEFVYGSRLDVSRGYTSGYEVITNKRLEKIIVRNAEPASNVSGLQEIRNYNLLYNKHNINTKNKYSYIAAIQECVSGNQCLPATYFDWTINKGFQLGSAGPALNGVIQKKSQLGQTVALDFDGDGDLDMAWLEYDENHTDLMYKLRYARYDQDQNKYVYDTFLGTSGDNCNGSGLSSSQIVYCENPSKWWENVRLQVIDYNADGRQDLAVFRDKFNSWKVYLSVPIGTTGPNWKLDADPISLPSVINDPNASFVDVDGDGLTDILTATKVYYLRRTSISLGSNKIYSYVATNSKNITWNGINQSLPEGQWHHHERAMISTNVDFNGDGAGDVVLVDRVVSESIRPGRGIQNYTIAAQQEHYYAAVRNTGVTTGVQFDVIQYLGGKSLNYNDGEASQYSHFDTGYIAGASIPPLISVNVADLNNDGSFEIAMERDASGSDDTGHYDLYMNKGGEFSSPITIASNTKTDKGSIQFADRNDDGYLDLVVQQEDSATITRYWAWLPESASFSSTSVFAGATLSDTASRYMYFDVSGDGHTDLIRYKDNKLEVFKNQVSGLDDVVTHVRNGLGGVTRISYELLNQSDNYLSLVDTSFVTEVVNNYPELDENGCYQAQVATHPVTGEGIYATICPEGEATTTVVSFDPSVFYNSLNNPFADRIAAVNPNDPDAEESLAGARKLPVMEYQAPIYVVTKVDGSAPAGSTTTPRQVSTGATSSIEYHYKHARLQGGGRGFLGFAEVTTVNAQNGINTSTEYRQDWPFIGYPLRTVTYAPSSEGIGAGKKMSEKTSTWGLYNWNGTFIPTYSSTTNGTAGLPPIKPYLKASREVTYRSYTNASEPASVVVLSNELMSVTVKNKYDVNGNPYEIVTVTEGSDGSEGYSLKKTIKNDYDNDGNYATQNNGSTMMLNNGISMSYAELGRLTHTRVETQRNQAAPTIRESAFTYITSSNAGSMRGLLSSETVEPNDSSIKTVKVYSYDFFGNNSRIETTGANQAYDQAGSWVFSPNQERVQAYHYDTAGRYIDYSTTGSGANTYVTEEVTERNIYGLPTRIENGLNDTVISISYDALGREIYRQDNADSVNNDGVGSWSAVEYLKCTSSLECPAGTSFVVRKTAAGGSLSLEYFDILGRTIRTATQGFAGRLSYVDSEYDKFGRGLRTSEPYFKGSVPVWTKNEYDIVGRVIKTTLPDNSVQTVSYINFTTRVTNALSQTRIDIKNSLGELVRVYDPINNRVEYTYNDRGDLESVTVESSTGKGGVTTNLTYDKLGRKLTMDDPDKGHWEYKYNTFGELVWQKDAKGQVVTQAYDSFGRMRTRTDYLANGDVENHTRWYYDGATDAGVNEVANAKLQVSAVVMTNSSSVETCTTTNAKQCSYPTYDDYGRPETATAKNVIDGVMETYTTSTLYDHYGRVQVQTDVLDGQVTSSSSSHNRYSDNSIMSGTRTHYDNYGFVERISDLQTGKNIYQLLDANARGQVVQDLRGNGVTSEYTYDDFTGHVIKQVGNIANLFKVQHIEYEWDAIGNLTYRFNNSVKFSNTGQQRNLKEAFCYDRANRLTKTLPGTTSTEGCSGLTGSTTDVTYDLHGNITKKTDVGTYAYGANNAGPHAVTSTSAGDAFYYDLNGNLTHDDKNDVRNRTLTYTTFDKPSQIIKGATGNPDHTTSFLYGIDRSRYLRTDVSKNGVTTTTQYLGNVEKIISSAEPSKIKWKRYLGSSAIVTVTTDNSLAQLSGAGGYEEVYVYNDHLGSLDVITNGVGTVVQSMSFNPWGGRRDSDSWTDMDLQNLVNQTSTLASLKQFTTRGFTGHEMLDEVGIIHMNGRIYDPRLGRFLQADPIIQAATNTQSYNRYSYAWNNPLNATDPSGYSVRWVHVRKGIRQAAAIVVAVVAAYYCGTECSAQAYAAIMAGAGAFGAMINGAGGSDILKAAVSGAIMGAVGYAVQGAYWLEKVVAMGVAGGITTVIQGGDVGNGMLAAGIGALSGTMSNVIPNASARIGVSAILGGTASKVTGGKFANGAATAAFSAVVSEGVSKKFTNSTSDDHKTADDNGDPIPKGISDKILVERAKELGLEVTGNKVVGTVELRCRSSSHVGGCILIKDAANEHFKAEEGAYEFDIDFVLVTDNGPRVIDLYIESRDPSNPAQYVHGTRSCFLGTMCRRDNSISIDESYMGGAKNPLLMKSLIKLINHEVGHAIGYQHQANPTQSFMSYSSKQNTSPTQEEAKRFAESLR